MDMLQRGGQLHQNIAENFTQPHIIPYHQFPQTLALHILQHLKLTPLHLTLPQIADHIGVWRHTLHNLAAAPKQFGPRGTDPKCIVHHAQRHRLALRIIRQPNGRQTALGYALQQPVVTEFSVLNEFDIRPF